MAISDNERLHRAHMSVYEFQTLMYACDDRVRAGYIDPEEGIRQVKGYADAARRQLKKIAPKRFEETREILLKRISEDEETLCGYIAKRINAE